MSHVVLLPTTKDPTLSKITLTDGQGKHLIGRGLHNTTVIEDVNISRSHCCLERKDGEWLLTDTSSNGTTVNGNLIHNAPHKLQDHDVIELSSKIAYEYLVCMETNISQTDVTDEVLNQITDTVLEAKLLMDHGDLETSNATQSKMSSQLDKVESQPPDLVEDEFQCSICTELFIKAVTLSCSHTFCKHCIAQWCKNQTVCPICRAEIVNQFPTIVLDNYIEKIVEGRDDEYRRCRKMIVDEREAEASAAPGPSSTNSRKRPPADLIEISSASSSDGEDNTDSERDSLYDEEEDEDYDCDFYYNGVPGRYYGGYGSCYRCGQRGHWANGCPFKRRR